MTFPDMGMAVYGLGAALVIGLLIGLERERAKGDGSGREAAGIRTFALLALCGAVAMLIGTAAVAVAGLAVGALMFASHRATRDQDPGLTTEVAMLATFLHGIRSNATSADAGKLGGKRPFEPLSALRFMAIFAGIILLAAIVRTHLGNASIPWVLGMSGIADVHAAAASAAQLVSSGEVDLQGASLGVLTALGANTVLKCVLALARGGGGYALRLVPGVLAATATFALVLFIG